MLRTPDAFVESLRDGRSVYYDGRRIPDVTVEPDLRVGVEHARLDFELAEDPTMRPHMVAVNPDTGREGSIFYRVPRSVEDVLNRGRAIELSTQRGRTIPPLIKEIGTDAMFALLRLTDGEGYERAQAYYEHCRDGDLAVSVAQTDVKGDRSLAPSAQPNPDVYVHVVERSDEGIVVRGAKTLTSGSVNANEVIVLPTRAMGPDDADYAISFATAVNTPGLSLYVSGYGAGPHDAFGYPLSHKARMLESLTVFDDVFVPWERVFCDRDARRAGLLALGFVDYHRYTAVSYKLPLLDGFVGAALRIAEINGLGRAGHIRDKLVALVAYAENVRGLTRLAAERARPGPRDVWVPDSMTVNLAKYVFASGYPTAVQHVQEISGGLLAAVPSGTDWESEEVRPVLERFYGAVAPAEERLRMLQAIGDMTVRDFGGYHAVLAVHAEGSIEAEKMQMFRAYDARSAKALADFYAALGEWPIPE